MRLAAALLVAVLLAGCMGEEAGEESPASDTELVIHVWPSGPQGESTSRTLRCPSTSGEELEERACAGLEEAGPELFEPVPEDVACNQIYGGPEVADVEGTLNGRRVSAHFNRSDGCEIERWNRARFLFPLG